MDESIASGKELTAEVREKVDRLIAILETHSRLHRRLLEILEAKKTAVVEARIDELESIVETERIAIEAVAASERQRIAQTAEVGEAFGFRKNRRMRLLDLIGLVGEDHREVLLDLRDDLREIADKMDRLNKLNRTLVLHSLEHVHLFLSMLRGKDPEAKIYTLSGDEGGKAESILLDRRI
jgi:flagellar biosynthesis/type III secretory pathway chaperone